MITLEEGRRVRLLVSLDSGEYQPGDTGYLHRWCFSDQPKADDWGVVFDKDGDDGHTVIRGTLATGEVSLLTEVVELIVPPADAAADPVPAGPVPPRPWILDYHVEGRDMRDVKAVTALRRDVDGDRRNCVTDARDRIRASKSRSFQPDDAA